MKKKAKFILLGGGGFIFFLFIIFLPIIFFIGIFTDNTVTDSFVEDNLEYANAYLSVVSKYVKNEDGYIPLNRILYFYEYTDYSFDEIYNDNLNKETKLMMPISEVCESDKYKNLEVCEPSMYIDSGQIDAYQEKPFVPPIDFKGSIITSFFMEQRYVFNSYSVHKGFDFGATANSNLYSVCDGTIKESSFKYPFNQTDTSGGLGNYIILECNIGDKEYLVYYGHLFPNSSKVKTGDYVLSGDKIAEVGTTGYSTGNHLHYQVMVDENYVDGMSLINFDNTPEKN